MNSLVFEYLVSNGTLTAPSGNPYDYVDLVDVGQGVTIKAWRFQQTQLTAQQIATYEASPGFQTYLTNRVSIIEKTEAKKFDADRRFIALALVVNDRLNAIQTKQTTPIPPVTVAQLKQAVKDKIDTL